jgi:hypothetical protein
MTAMDRTAYPRPGERLTREELDARYSLNETDHAFIGATARGDAGRLTLAALLKTRQDLGCFPAPGDLHGQNERNALLVRISRQMANPKETKEEYGTQKLSFVWLSNGSFC